MATRGVSSRNASAVGMMEGAFFVSRTELIAWVNNLLQVSLTKVEQCASGAIYCQILDACQPGSVAMRKVNWMAKADHEFIPNYKVLQAAFDKLGIEKHIDVDKLIRAKYQDNLEFLQWMKCYWERERSGCEDYDPLAPRETKPVPPWARSAAAIVGVGGAGDKENARPRAPHREEPARKLGSSVSEKVLSARPVTAGGNVCGNGRTPRVSATAKPVHHHHVPDQQEECARKARELQEKMLEESRSRLTAQNEEMEEMRAALDGLERERDYYFKKLRQVEIFCETFQAQMECEQVHHSPMLTPNKLVQEIQGILYAADEAPEAAVNAGGSEA